MTRFRANEARGGQTWELVAHTRPQATSDTVHQEEARMRRMIWADTEEQRARIGLGAGEGEQGGGQRGEVKVWEQWLQAGESQEQVQEQERRGRQVEGNERDNGQEGGSVGCQCRKGGHWRI